MRIAAVQCLSIADDEVRASDAIVQRLHWADEQGIDLLVFPEAFLSGHSYDLETIRSRARASAAAISNVCRRAAPYRATFAFGAFELCDGRIFNSAIIVEAGRILGRYAKAYPNEPGVTAGNRFPTFVRAGVRYGVNICNDANYPDAAQRIAMRGASLILYPLNNMLPPQTAERWRERSMTNLIERARQTGCWIASADVVGRSGELVSYGCTAIVTPDGSVAARVVEMQEGVAIYDLPFE